jgi:hypothetical protein
MYPCLRVNSIFERYSFFIILNPYWKIIEMINTQPWFIEFSVDWSVTPKPTIQVKSLTPPRISTEGKSWQDLDKDDDHCENSPECSAILESYLPEIKDSNWTCPTYLIFPAINLHLPRIFPCFPIFSYDCVPLNVGCSSTTWRDPVWGRTATNHPHVDLINAIHMFHIIQIQHIIPSDYYYTYIYTLYYIYIKYYITVAILSSVFDYANLW